MDDFPRQLADFLESIARRVRSLTVDRVAYWTTIGALGLVATTLGIVAAIFLLIGLFRLLSSVIGVTTTYAVMAGLFLVVGAFLWFRRTKPPKEAV